jgi:nitrate/nitrite transporter NarK
VTIGGGVTAVEAPLLYPYYPKQLIGLMGGLQGAAEYEAALMTGKPRFADTATTAMIRMFPQTVAHVVIVLFVVLGNISYFATKRRERRF